MCFAWRFPVGLSQGEVAGAKRVVVVLAVVVVVLAVVVVLLVVAPT